MPMNKRCTPEEIERYWERVRAYREQGMPDWDARELARYENAPYPGDGMCPKCGSALEEFSGMVGESHVVCTNSACDWSWTDTVGAIAAVI